MQYVHVKNIERFHPGYKDRQLLWAKIHIAMAQGDPEMEMIESETDKWRFICLILLELQAKKPLPLNDQYFIKKGFDIKKRPMSLTLKMLHNFLDIVTEETKVCVLEENRIEENSVTLHKFNFNEILAKYPNRDGSKKAKIYFDSSVKTEEDWININKALENYLDSPAVLKGFIKNASTWFNNWKDWIEYKNPNPETLNLG